jgi:transcriptional regulator with XRE-family HTH domain
MMQSFSTVRLRDEAERTEELQDLRALVARYDRIYISWPREFTRLLDESGLSYQKLSERSGLSRNTLRRWCRGITAPRCRSEYLRLAFAFGMTPEEAGVLLTRCGGYPGLYPRDRFDAACIFLLLRGGCRYEDAEALFALCARDGEPLPDKTTCAAETLRAMATQEEFLRFAERSGAPLGGHEALRAFLAERLRACGLDPVTGESLCIHALFSQERIPARFEKDVSQLLLRGVVPRREKLIALGIRLGLLTDDLDEMLSLAGMEPLCSKNRVECILIGALQQLELLHPELELDSAARLLAAANSPTLSAQCRALLQESAAREYKSAPEDAASAAEYLRGVLEELDPGQAAELLGD